MFISYTVCETERVHVAKCLCVVLPHRLFLTVCTTVVFVCVCLCNNKKIPSAFAGVSSPLYTHTHTLRTPSILRRTAHYWRRATCKKHSRTHKIPGCFLRCTLCT